MKREDNLQFRELIEETLKSFPDAYEKDGVIYGITLNYQAIEDAFGDKITKEEYPDLWLEMEKWRQCKKAGGSVN